jgi:hypothetical protein
MSDASKLNMSVVVGARDNRSTASKVLLTFVVTGSSVGAPRVRKKVTVHGRFIHGAA